MNVSITPPNPANIIKVSPPSGGAVVNVYAGIAGPTGPQGPQGIQGPQGNAATIAVGTTTTGSSGTSASVSNSGSSSAAVFNFTIPKGDPGTTSWNGLTDKPSSFPPSTHASSHASGGSEPISIANTQVSGLGTASTKNVATSGDASSTQVVMGNDSRLTNSRTPTAHASSHAAGGSDPISLSLSQIAQSGASTNQVPKWNGTNWVPSTPAPANPFDQTLNTTSDVKFDSVKSTDNGVTWAINADGTISFASGAFIDIDGGGNFPNGITGDLLNWSGGHLYNDGSASFSNGAATIDGSGNTNILSLGVNYSHVINDYYNYRALIDQNGSGSFGGYFYSTDEPQQHYTHVLAYGGPALLGGSLDLNQNDIWSAVINRDGSSSFAFGKVNIYSNGSASFANGNLSIQSDGGLSNPNGNFVRLANPNGNNNLEFANNLGDDLALIDPDSNGVLFYFDRRPAYGNQILTIYTNAADGSQDPTIPAFKFGVDGALTAKSSVSASAFMQAGNPVSTIAQSIAFSIALS